MQLTAKLWARDASVWPACGIDARSISLSKTPEQVQSTRGKGKGKKKKITSVQQKAYIEWKESVIDDWLQNLQCDKEAPTTEQMDFLKRVVDRCRQEARSLLGRLRGGDAKTKSRRCEDKPILDCLLGIPGAGKSKCIHLLRRFFEECLKWEDGVQFQFLASQNTMAALIGGRTLHGWASIPVNASLAFDKANCKGDDGDVSELFLKAQAMRWIIIDEVSTVSPELLGLLDLYLRRACARHPYATLSDSRHKVAFGGINLVLAGDLWQLTPVKAHSLFNNPFLTGYTSVEQRIYKMFWDPDSVDAVQKTWVLTKPMRTKDRWLQEVLQASRFGNESWEMYCFNHGYPTRNPGSWLPSLDKPTCNNEVCMKLATEIWPEMWRRGSNSRESWKERCEKECCICKQAHLKLSGG
jgi:hypothetical protein